MAIEQFIFRGRFPFTWRHKTPDYACMKKAAECEKIEYPKPDGVISFDNYLQCSFQTLTMKKTNPVI